MSDVKELTTDGLSKMISEEIPMSIKQAQIINNHIRSQADEIERLKEKEVCDECDNLSFCNCCGECFKCIDENTSSFATTITDLKAEIVTLDMVARVRKGLYQNRVNDLETANNQIDELTKMVEHYQKAQK